MILFIDATNGISGDMFASALFDLGAFTRREAKDIVRSLYNGKVDVDFKRIKRQGMRAVQLIIKAAETDLPTATYIDMQEMLSRLSLPPRAKEIASTILQTLAQAESMVHNVPISEVHFHEIGGYDTLIDCVLAGLGVANLDIDECYVSPINVGTGIVHIAHGTFASPAPATAELLTGCEIMAEGDKELTTPTGAAIVRALAKNGKPKGRIVKIGYGSGSYNFEEKVDMLRLMLLSPAKSSSEDRKEYILIETNLDDINPEHLAGYLEELIDMQGVRDAWQQAVYMKKGRIGLKLSVIVEPEYKEEVIKSIFKHTTTFGVRFYRVEREELEREEREVQLYGHKVRVKLGFYEGNLIKVKPEFADIKEISVRTGRSFQSITDEIMKKIDTF